MIQERGQLPLPNGCTLFWEPNGAGGRRYSSDEIGGGTIVWDTCLVEKSTLLAAMNIEEMHEREQLRCHKAYLAT